MARFISSVIALLASTAILLTGHGLQMTVSPLLALELGFSELEIGYQGSAYFLGFIFGCLGIPRLIRNVGHIRVFLVLIALATVALLVLGLGAHLMLWLIAKGLSGFCLSGLYMVIESWLNESSTPQNRGSVLSVYSVITLIAISVGQLFISFDLPFSQLLLVGAIFILLSAMPVGLTRSASPGPLNQVSFKAKQVYRDSKIALFSVFLFGLVGSGFWALGPVIAKTLSLRPDQISVFMATTLLGGALSQMPIGRYSDRVDRRIVIAGLSGAASIVAVAALIVDITEPSILYVIMFLFGASTFPLYSISLAHANDNSTLTPIETGSVILLTFSTGSVIGPPLISMVQMQTNLGIYWVTFLMLAPFSVITFFRTQTIPATQKHFAPFQDVPVTTQEIINLSAEIPTEDESAFNEAPPLVLPTIATPRPTV